MPAGPELTRSVRAQTSGVAGEHLPSHVAVVRDAFGAHDDSHRRLAQEVAALGPDKVRLLHATVSSPSLISVPQCHVMMAPSVDRHGPAQCLLSLLLRATTACLLGLHSLGLVHRLLPLATSQRACAPPQVAVTADLAHPHNRLIVDDYELDEDKQSYRLRTVGTGEQA